MEKVLNYCIKRVIEKSTIKEIGNNHDKSPQYPTLVINYNLDNNSFQSYSNFMRQLWPKVHLNLEYMNKDEEERKFENKIRQNETFDNFNTIHIHILYDVTRCETADIQNYIKDTFDELTHKIKLHAFFDYSSDINTKENDKKLIELMNCGDFQYLFIYSNCLKNGALWIGDNAMKLMRLSANITAIMAIDSHFFQYGNCYTFSYNILEKPTKKIIQHSIKRLLINLSDYECPENLEKNIEKEFSTKIRKTVDAKIRDLRFREDDFEYLPSNKEMLEENKSIVKNMEIFKKNHSIALACYNAMLTAKLDILKKINLEDIDYTKELDTILNFYFINGYLSMHKQEDLYDSLQGILLHENEVSVTGSYLKFLADYANQKLLTSITEKIFSIFRNQLIEKISISKSIDSCIKEALNSDALIINAVDREKNLEEHYDGIIDHFFSAHRADIFADIDQGVDFDSFLERLEIVMMKVFDSNKVFYKSFEDEIDERVGKNTAKTMFEAIDSQTKINNNICFNNSNLQLDITKTRDVVLLLNPESNLKRHNITNNYHLFELTKQDCVERIDFHILEYRGNE